MDVDRRTFLSWMAALSAQASLGCVDESRYGSEDEARLEKQRREEAAAAGRGPHGKQLYRGYRGLADLPWFDIDDRNRIVCSDPSVPAAIDLHAHFGMSLLFAPALDLQARTARVEHLLDCDVEEAGCPLDLDVYANANFAQSDLDKLHREAVAQLLWGSRAAVSHTIPNLLDEMDDSRVGQSVILPIEFGLPFGDRLTDRWLEAMATAGAEDRLIPGASVHPRASDAVERLRGYAARGARIVKLHPAGQRFFPDSPELAPIYEECGRLGLPIFFHGGRAGIEPAYAHQFTLMRHYEGAFREFPDVQFVLGHAGARDVSDAIPLARRFDNVWMGIHGQGVSQLDGIIDALGTDRLLFGSDWPFYHQIMSLAKVLIVTEARPEAREPILRGNASRLLSLT